MIYELWQRDHSYTLVGPYATLKLFAAVMLSPRGQAVLEAKILSSTSTSKICPRPQTRPRAFVLGLSSNFLFWPRENVCNAGIGKKRRTALFGHYRTAAASQSPLATSFTTASQQLHRYMYLTVINSETFDPTAASSHLDKLMLDFPLMQPLFSRVFCVPASSAPVEKIFSHSGMIMSARRAHMSNAVLDIVFLKCNSHL